MKWWMRIKTFVVFSAVNLGLKVWGYEKVLDFVVRRSSRKTRRTPAEVDPKILVHSEDAMTAVRRYYYRKQKDCLPRALTTFYLLRGQGVPVSYRLGVKKFPFAAHSWVEFEGRVVNDLPGQRDQYKLITVVDA